MEDLEPELLIIEEHENCRQSNQIQFLLSKQCIPYWKVTLGTEYTRCKSKILQLPCIFLGGLLMGGLKELKDFINQAETNR